MRNRRFIGVFPRTGCFRTCRTALLLFSGALLLPAAVFGASGELLLQDLIDEALRNNHEILISSSRVAAYRARISQAQSLPDPMIMIGYQNEGWNRYTYGEMEGAQWMFSASQMLPFPGKRSLKGEMATQDSEGAAAALEAARLNTVARVKELYFDLALGYRNLDLIRDRASLFSRIEEAAVARYASGMGPQQEVLRGSSVRYRGVFTPNWVLGARGPFS